MKLSDFDFDLPRELIAQRPMEPRDAARLLLVDRRHGRLEHRKVRDLPELLSRGDLIVVNDVRVDPARLFCRKPTGGVVELLFIEALESGPGQRERWRVAIGASHAPKVGSELLLPDQFSARLCSEVDRDGTAVIGVVGPTTVDSLLQRHGKLPVPPYIERSPSDPADAEDRVRYQTVYAGPPGALAAPTAGLHFTAELLDRLERCGIKRASVTLQVGEGTFRPLRVDDLEQVSLHSERFELPESSSAEIAAARKRGSRVVAIGTTTVRTLEARAEDERGGPVPGSGETALFIAPGFEFRFVDALLTNFHLPRSSLFMLVSAFLGRRETLAAYREAVERGYRFYSYGDAMLVL